MRGIKTFSLLVSRLTAFLSYCLWDLLLFKIFTKREKRKEKRRKTLVASCRVRWILHFQTNLVSNNLCHKAHQKKLNQMNLHENNNISTFPSLVLILGRPTNCEYVDKRDFVGILASKPRQQQNQLLQSSWVIPSGWFLKVFKATKLFQNAR